MEGHEEEHKVVEVEEQDDQPGGLSIVTPPSRIKQRKGSLTQF